MSPNKENSVSFRSHMLRPVQKALEPIVPSVILGFYHAGLLTDTCLGEALKNREKYSADDVTLSGLQLTLRAADNLVSEGSNAKNFMAWNLGAALDAADGSIARSRGTASAEGAMKDVLADRIGDIKIAHIVANEQPHHPFMVEFVEHQLQTAFLLSTLTKALSEMYGVSTKEGGLGSMMERRRLLYGVLADLGTIGNTRNRNLRCMLTIQTDNSIRYLTETSRNRAWERANAIDQALCNKTASPDNPALRDNPMSGAAIEARKYVAVLTLPGIDMMPVLNRLNANIRFPTAHELIDKYDYIRISMQATAPFRDEAFEIAGIKSPNLI